jgi:hypothetical protein
MTVNCGACGAGLPLRLEYYRENARECLRLANTTSDLHSKVALIDMALAWRRLADQAESFRSQSYTHFALILDRETACGSC